MKYFGPILAAAALILGMAVTGCEMTETCDPNTDPDCVVEDAGNTTTDTGTQVDQGQQGQSYHYVLIEDRTTDERPDQTGGADIAGVELVKSGSSFFASQVHWCEFGNFDNSDAEDCNQALGAPASGQGECNPSASVPDFVSLGGVGGQLIVSFGNLEEIVEGARIFVYECGRQQNPSAVDEPFDMRVGVATQPSDPNWLPCISNGTGIVDCTVPALPLANPN